MNLKGSSDASNSWLPNDGKSLQRYKDEDSCVDEYCCEDERCCEHGG